jgi:peptidoglycan hydrolase CwlO-like protein
MARFARAVTALVGVAATVLTAGVLPHAAADPLGDAKAKAAALTRTVDQLRTQAEVATERFDQAETKLSVAVAAQGQADQQLSATQASASAAQQAVSDRARALYESGGNAAAFASLLSGQSPTDAIDRYQLADDVIAYQSRVAQAATATLTQARALDVHDAAISRQVTSLQVARQADAIKVQSLLTAQSRALAAADSTVRRIMRADEAAAAAAAAAEFTGAVTAAGGSIKPR